MRKFIETIALSISGALIAGPALAVAPAETQIPEPGLIGLFAAGAVAVILLKNRNRE